MRIEKANQAARSKLLGLAGFIFLLIFTGPAVAQVTDIAVAKTNLWVDGTNTFFAANTGNYFTVVGRVTSPFLGFTSNTEVYIQDASGGLEVLSDNTGGQFLLETNSSVFVPGVEVTVYGKIAQTNGMRMIRPEYYNGQPYNIANDLYISGTTTTPVSPEVTTITNYLAQAEDIEGKLVRINGLTIGTNAWTYQANSTLTITDSTGIITLFIDRDTDVDGQLPPNGTFDLIGLANQFSTLPIPSNGYEIMPRSYSDVIQTNAQEAPSILAPATVVGTVGSLVSAWVVGQDRNAADVLSIGTNVSPVGSTFTPGMNREWRFTWTPGSGLENTTNDVTFNISDGTVAVTSTMKIIVRSLSGGPGYAWINEFHYDNTSTDVGEGIELAGQSGIDLTNYYVILYNLSGAVYGSNAFGGPIDNEGQGYGAVWKGYPTDGLRNTQGGIALCHVTNGLLQFISYGGAFTATNGIASGVTAVDVAVFEGGSTPAGYSLQLQGNGTNYEAFTWTGPMPATPGDLNGSGQIIIGPVNAKVTYTNLTLSPAKPAPGSAFDITCMIITNYSASNVVATAWYRINAGGWTSIGMTDLGGYTNKTSSQIPAQTNGTPIDYYVSATFEGPSAVSPAVSVTNSAVIQSFPPTIAPLTNRSVQVSNTLSFAVSATEPDGDLITLTASNLPANANFYPTNGVGASAGSFVFTPDVSQVGVYTASFYAVDKDGAVFSNVVITVNPQGYFIDFESESKGSYASATVALSGLNWDMTDSLIGNLASDRKIGNWSARFRTLGSMTMLADKTKGCGTISFKYGRYGTDAATTGKVEYSTDGGANWTPAGSEFTASATNPMSDFSATISQTGGVRMRIVKLSGSSTARFNVDDILMTDFAGGGGFVDGIPVSWWDQYSIPTLERIATNNPDNDTANNLEEYLADTIPTNSDSCLGFVDFDLSAPTVVARFKGGTQAVQIIEFTTDLNSTNWQFLSSNMPPTSVTNTFGTSTGAAAEFYRVRAHR